LDAVKTELFAEGIKTKPPPPPPPAKSVPPPPPPATINTSTDPTGLPTEQTVNVPGPVNECIL
jgi:hypothetical protein